MDALTDDLLNAPVWHDQQLPGDAVIDVPIVSAGGGFGSLAVVSLLRLSGLGTDSIAVLTRNDYPHENYRFLARNSQILDDHRLRSDSSAMPDNSWGFPSYALREARHGTPSSAWQVAVEPVLAEFFTPVSGEVFQATQQEADRIGWPAMVRHGQVRMVRPRAGGGYFTVLTTQAGGAKQRVFFRSRYVHLGLGYAGATFLPDLQEYRTRTGDVTRVVNAYENHTHVYDEALRTPTTVVIRGSGIVASRVLQRLLDDHEQRGAQTTVLHLFRNYPVEETSGRRRKVVLGFSQQPFNLCKSTFGGGMAERIAKMPDLAARIAAIQDAAGTTTAKRAMWFDQLQRCLDSGHYRQVIGTVGRVDGDANDLDVTIEIDGGQQHVHADFIIDATGLQAAASDHRVLADMLHHHPVTLNPLRRITTNQHFEIAGLTSEPGRAFLTGAMSMGNYFGPVDSFYGLQWSAWRVLDRISGDGFVRRLGSMRSINQWFRRMRGVAP